MKSTKLPTCSHILPHGVPNLQFLGMIFGIFLNLIFGLGVPDIGSHTRVSHLGIRGLSMAMAQFGAQSFGSHFTGQAANRVQNGAVFRETPRQTETRYQQDQNFQRQTMARQQAETWQDFQSRQQGELRVRQAQLEADATLRARESTRLRRASDTQRLNAIEQQRLRTSDGMDFFRAPYPLPDAIRAYRETEYQPGPPCWVTPEADPVRPGPRFTRPNHDSSEVFKNPSWAKPQYRDTYLALQTDIQWAETRTDPGRFRWAPPSSASKGPLSEVSTPAPLTPQWQLASDRTRQAELWRRQFATELREHTPHWYHRDWWATHPPVIAPWWHFQYSYLHYPPEYWWKTPAWQDLTIWLAPWNWYEPLIYEYGVGGNAIYDAQSVWINGVRVSSITDFRDSAATLATPQVVLTPAVTPAPVTATTPQTALDPAQSTSSPVTPTKSEAWRSIPDLTEPSTIGTVPPDTPMDTAEPSADAIISPAEPVQPTDRSTDTTALSTARRMEWFALGTFAMVTESAVPTSAQQSLIIQLAVDRNGLLSGNFYDPSKPDATFAVVGRIDGQTERAAFTIACFDNLVFETGAYHLTQTEATILIHDGSQTLRTCLLIRLEPPSDIHP